MNKKLMLTLVAFTSMTQIQAMFSGPARQVTTKAGNIVKKSSTFTKFAKTTTAASIIALTGRVAYQAQKNEFDTQATKNAILQDINTVTEYTKEQFAKVSDFVTKNSGNDTPPTA